MTLISSPMQIVYCADRNVEIGLHASIRSLLANTGSPVELSILVDVDRGIDRELVREAVGQRAGVHFHDVDAAAFRAFLPLVGNRFSYSKLLIPELVSADRVIYLDTDTIIDTDLSALWHVSIEGAPLGAVSEHSVASSLERQFLGTCGLSDDQRYFNTGVLLMNCAFWRQNDLTGRTMKFAAENSRFLKAADQTVMNALLATTIIEIAPRFNLLFWPQSKQSSYERGQNIFHYCGGLKPWDPFCSGIHAGYPLWSFYDDKKITGRMRKNSAVENIRRAARRFRYYWHALRGRYRQGWSRPQ